MDEQQIETELADSEPERRRGPWKLILLVVVATLIGVWLVPGEEPQQTELTDGGLPPSLLDLPPTAAGGEPVLPEALEEPAVDDSPGGRARALIAEMRSSGELRLDEIFAAADQAQRDGEAADAYLLYFFAARQGHPASALELGRQADPAGEQAGERLFDSPDLTQAHKWYQIAAASGDPEARQRLDQLRQRVEQMAASGDAQAQRIALQWQ
jgi:hypothetical protein